MLHRLKALVPAPMVSGYHRVLARLADVYYGHPSRKMVVIGVTGTNGKTTTAYFLAKALEASGSPTGCTTTAIMKIADREWVNRTKMTMPGRFYLQRMLKEMVQAGCRYAVVETSSQGLVQHRHEGIAYDVAVFTNLTPEHIEAHGGFENYKRAKRLLFSHVAAQSPKRIGGRDVVRAGVLNADDPHAEFYAEAMKGVPIHWFSVAALRGLQAHQVRLTETGSSFLAGEIPVTLQIPGIHNVSNAMAALQVCQALGVDLVAAAKKLGEIRVVPGRMQRVEAGQPWEVIVDYAPEPVSLQKMYDTLSFIPHARLIHVLGSCGGGRDVARRPVLGRMAGSTADVVIVTNEDPYDDDPREIMAQVASGAREVGKREGENLFIIEDRAAAIQCAMELAQPKDVILLTGKGHEPWICGPNGSKTPWNEVATAEGAIRRVLNGGRS